ncbi:MAG: STAS domain-containing protein [Ferruginibacter sp.]
MKLKIDTKEKFTVLTPEEPIISANMTEEIRNICAYASSPVPHLVINMKMVNEIDKAAAEQLAQLQQLFYEKDCSLVMCELQPAVEAVFEQKELTEVMNITPTETEAWDIVQMEEIERELLNDFDEEEN